MPNEIDVSGLRAKVELERAIGWANINVDAAIALLDEFERLRDAHGLSDVLMVPVDSYDQTLAQLRAAEAERDALQQRLRLLENGDVAAENATLKAKLGAVRAIAEETGKDANFETYGECQAAILEVLDGKEGKVGYDTPEEALVAEDELARATADEDGRTCPRCSSPKPHLQPEESFTVEELACLMGWGSAGARDRNWAWDAEDEALLAKLRAYIEARKEGKV